MDATNAIPTPVFEIKGTMQNYLWGRQGLQSKVAQLMANSHPDTVIDENLHYAELWLGTHVSQPSVIVSKGHLNGTTLSEYITKNPRVLGEKIKFQFGDELPFLLKILSVECPLSIQMHPDKVTAEKIHAERPDLYPDSNHKPEIAIALSEFYALCGFRPVEEIVYFMKNIPELGALIEDENIKLLEGAKNCEETKQALHKCFESLMLSPEAKLKDLLNTLIGRLKQLSDSDQEQLCYGLLSRCNQYFPGDVGCFAIYFLNYLELKPGQSIFLAANEPHAYIFGDCVECMACSDNVIRAGLSPKFKDVQRLCDLLSYKTLTPKEVLFEPDVAGYITTYSPPVPDFAVDKIQIPMDVNRYELAEVDSASIVITTEGGATVVHEQSHEKIKLRAGTAFFVAQGTSLWLEDLDQSEALVLYRARCIL